MGKFLPHRCATRSTALSPLTRQQFIRARALIISGWNSKRKIVKATSNQTKKLNDVLDADAGAVTSANSRSALIRTFCIRCAIFCSTKKIAGSFHFTPGQAYETADNGNRSQVHWDMVNIQRREYGGGEIYFDGKLIRKNGEFVVPALQSLKPGKVAQAKIRNRAELPARFPICFLSETLAAFRYRIQLQTSRSRRCSPSARSLFRTSVRFQRMKRPHPATARQRSSMTN